MKDGKRMEAEIERVRERPERWKDRERREKESDGERRREIPSGAVFNARRWLAVSCCLPLTQSEPAMCPSATPGTS